MNPSGLPDPTRAGAAAARDAALTRVGHARRWAIVGSAGLSAAFAALVSTSPPSKATTTAKTTPKTTPTAPAPRGSAPALPPLADGSALGLQGPSQAPSADQGQAAPQPQSQPQSAPSQQSQSAPDPAAAQPQAPVSGGS